MIRIRSICSVVCVLATVGASTASRADEFWDDVTDGLFNVRSHLIGRPIVEPTYHSPYVDWMARTELGSLAAPIAISNQPCFGYSGPRVVIKPCPGAAVYAQAYGAEPYVIPAGPLADGVPYRRGRRHVHINRVNSRY